MPRLRLAFLSSFLLGLTACQPDVTGTATDLAGETRSETTPTTESAELCGGCLFEPVVYTRQTGTPVTEVITFGGDPAGAYDLEIDDFDDRGANAQVVLNGDTLTLVDGRFAEEVVLAAENRLSVRLTGKPGSRLSVRLFQEVASVAVTPGTAQARVGATRQFAAVARDRNGVAIPGQTFTWTSLNTTIAEVNGAGLARTVGAKHETTAFRYLMESSGSGTVQIVAHADGAPPEMAGSAAWRVTQGFVYITYRAPRALDSEKRASRPAAEAIRYDVMQLRAMENRCRAESGNIEWWPAGEADQGEFRQCYMSLELLNRTRSLEDGVYDYGTKVNVGLYGRYCGGGHPDGTWWRRVAGSTLPSATTGSYPPKDPIDGLCMEHDRSLDNHDLDPGSDALLAACIVRYGIDSERLYEDGVLIEESSARWQAFWNDWPAMAQARGHWLEVTTVPCGDLTYAKFKRDRGLPLFGV